MQKVLSNIKAHLPYYIGIVLVVVNALVDNGTLSVSNHAANLINAILAAFGLGVLHYRSASATK